MSDQTKKIRHTINVKELEILLRGQILTLSQNGVQAKICLADIGFVQIQKLLTKVSAETQR